MLKSIRSLRLKEILLVFALFTPLSCATPSIPPRGAGGPSGPAKPDEAQILADAQSVEKRFEESNVLFRDPALEEYLEKIGQSLLTRGFQAANVQAKVRVIRNPVPNAFALGNGTLYIHTGTLARFENEDQLAIVLGHELAHFLHGHQLKKIRNAENRKILLEVFKVVFTVATMSFGGFYFLEKDDAGTRWVLSATRGYSRELESEADLEGLKAAVRCGYKPEEAARALRHAVVEPPDSKEEDSASFSTHPALPERIEKINLFIAREKLSVSQPDRVATQKEFEFQIDKILLPNAALEIKAGQLQGAEKTLGRKLASSPEDAQAHFLMGEFHRLSGNSPAQAVAAYQEASRLDPAWGDPHRELGLIYREQNLPQEAAGEFEKYIALKPDAVDVLIIKAFLAELHR